MKNLLLFILMLVAGFGAQAQTNVYFKINHKLDNADFALNQTATTNGRNPVSYQLTRLEYFIAEITLHHDGGQKTTIDDHWILVDASKPTFDSLGSYNITQLDSVSFGIGVEASANHSDPSLRPAGHPLANRSPSMHWGWAAGYRFVALEGKTGPSMNQSFQIHSLGNRNYQIQKHEVSGYLYNGDLIIHMDAEYNALMDNIIVSGILINHSEFGEAATVLDNFSRKVFNEAPVGIKENPSIDLDIMIAPNPSAKEFNIALGSKFTHPLNYLVTDYTGREIQEGVLVPSKNNRLSLEQEGVYFLNLYDRGSFVGTKKVVIQ